jgi:outer membrane protein OmpA-like peptidoglycan-associated protein
MFLALTASSSLAQLPQGPYVRLEGGWSHPEDLSGSAVTGIPAGNATRDEGYIFGLAGGYKWQKWRAELDLDYSRNDLKNGSNVFAAAGGSSTSLKGSSSNFSFMLNGYYDLATGTPFTPYIGFGIGGDRFSLDKVRTNVAPYSGIANSADIVFAYQPIIGVAYSINDHMSLGLEYRYFSTTDASIKYAHVPPGGSFNVDPSSHNILASFTFHFGAPAAPPVPAPVPAAAAAPAPPPAPSKQEFIVFFEFDKSTLTPDGQKVVDAAAAAYKKGGSAKISVAGYTDAAGTATYNMALSQRRAQTVSTGLVKDGVPQNQIAVSAFGKDRQRVPTPDGVREPQNRRVEIDF